MDEYSDSNSGDELELMALAVALAAKKKKKRKHLVWMKEIFLDRKNEGSRKLVNSMRVSNRDWYFKYLSFFGVFYNVQVHQRFYNPRTQELANDQQFRYK